MSLLLGDGHGHFSPAAGSPFGLSDPYGVAVGDFTGDGFADLVVTQRINGTASVLLGNGSGGFAATSDSPIHLGLSGTMQGVTVADFDGDGNLDFAVLDFNNGNLWIGLGQGNGAFAIHAFTVPGTFPVPGTLAVGDLNGDGKLDVAIANTGNDTAVLMFGDGAGGFPTSQVLAVTSPQGIAMAT